MNGYPATVIDGCYIKIKEVQNIVKQNEKSSTVPLNL